MSNRHKYKGEEDLQLRLLEVTEGPTFDDHGLRKKKMSMPLGMKDDNEQSEMEQRENCKLH